MSNVRGIIKISQSQFATAPLLRVLKATASRHAPLEKYNARLLISVLLLAWLICGMSALSARAQTSPNALLVKAVTSHGPIDPKRKAELETLFKGSSAGLVIVTTFLSSKAMVKYLPTISWETEVWVADTPSHRIHFNGDRFLGP